MFDTALKRLAHRFRDFLIKPLLKRHDQYSDAASQLHLKFRYQELVALGDTLPAIPEVGFKAYSQSDEDGILLFIFSVIGTHNKQSVEICAGNGIECNSANLIITHGWHGLLVDGNENLVKIGKDFYARSPHTYVFPPKLVHAWITRDNVNQLIEDNGFKGEIDLLSLDMDGVDYWILKTINVIQPRVIVVEYNDSLGPDRAWTVPYEDSFSAKKYQSDYGTYGFLGASLLAFAKLLNSKGYRLVGCNRYGYNAFFVRNSLAQKELPDISINECFSHPKARREMHERFPKIKDLPWVEV